MKALFAIAALTVLVEAGGQPQIRTTVSGVVLNVFVSQRNTPVDGLTAADFVVLDEGVPQAAEVVMADRVPLDLTLIFGASERTLEYLKDLKTAVPAIASRLRPDDRVQLIVCGARVQELTPFVRAADLRASLLDAIDAFGSAGAADGAEMNGALVEAMAQHRSPDRQPMILAADDWLGNGVISARALSSAAKMTDSVIYFANLPERRPYGSERLRFLADAIRTTGGQLLLVTTPHPVGDVYDSYNFIGPGPVAGVDKSQSPVVSYNDMVSTFAGLVTAYHRSYIVSFNPKGVHAGGWHTLTVNVNRPGKYVVRTRTGYYGVAGSTVR